MNAFVYNVQIKREKWLTPQIHAWAVMLTLQLPSVISSAEENIKFVAIVHATSSECEI